MKRTFLLVASSILTLASSEALLAQGTSEKSFRYSAPEASKKISKKNSAWISKKDLSEVNSFMLSHHIVSQIDVTSVNKDAVKDFTRSHKHVTQPNWFKTEAGYLSSFVLNGVFTKIAYDNNGSWLYKLTEYAESHISFELRDIVKRRYHDYDILSIHEYEFENDRIVYMIVMQDRQSNLVTLKVCNEEMDLVAPRN